MKQRVWYDSSNDGTRGGGDGGGGGDKIEKEKDSGALTAFDRKFKARTRWRI